MSLRGRLLDAVRRITGSERVADRLMAHISSQTSDLIAHLNDRTAGLLCQILASAEHGGGRHLAELYGMVGRALFRRLGYEGLKIDVWTEKPVAYDSPDHLMPWGTRQDNSTNLAFNVKLARWIDPADLRVLENIDAHLEPNGVVVMSVSPRPDVVNGVALHQTVEGPDWWLKLCERNGFVHHDAAVRYFRGDWVRSEPNAPQSFHLVLTRRAESLWAPLPTPSRAAA